MIELRNIFYWYIFSSIAKATITSSPYLDIRCISLPLLTTVSQKHKPLNLTQITAGLKRRNYNQSPDETYHAISRTSNTARQDSKMIVVQDQNQNRSEAKLLGSIRFFGY